MVRNNKSILDYMPKKSASKKRNRDEEGAENEKPDQSAEKSDEAPATKRAKTDDGVDSAEKDTTVVTAGTSTVAAATDATGDAAEKGESETVVAPAADITFENFETSLDPSWRSHIAAEFKKPYFLSLKKFLVQEAKQGSTIFPPVEDVFNAFRLCKYDKLKVVLIGQDPYIQKGQAHGLCFSVISENVARPPSLKNIFTEMQSDISGFTPPKHSNLAKWAEQGILLLNAVLTVREGISNSHAKKGWETFTDAVIEHLNLNKKGLIFLLWGKPAQDKGKHIDTKKHHVLKAAHPSPLSASKGFFGCKHFSKCNDLLPADQQINWKKICE